MVRIVIETDEPEKRPVRTEGAQEPQREAAGAVAGTPPSAIAAQAAAIGASSAGQAPAEFAGEGPTPFVTEPGTPETAPAAGEEMPEAMSAGAAPGFASGRVIEREAETEEAAEDDPES